MPVTPFHFGPGYLIKAFFDRKFNFLCFVCSQILIDFETLYNIVAGNPRLHTFLHSYLGSLAIIPAAAGCVHALKAVFPRLTSEETRPSVLFFSALIGAWSHVLLDGIMHADVRPLWPFSSVRVLHDAIDVGYLHVLCLVCGFVGLVWKYRGQFKERL